MIPTDIDRSTAGTPADIFHASSLRKTIACFACSTLVGAICRACCALGTVTVGTLALIENAFLVDIDIKPFGAGSTCWCVMLGACGQNRASPVFACTHLLKTRIAKLVVTRVTRSALLR